MIFLVKKFEIIIIFGPCFREYDLSTLNFSEFGLGIKVYEKLGIRNNTIENIFKVIVAHFCVEGLR